eukprot:scaffold64495_cov38-Cyclotella_meneghiniana.AAC.1
MPNKKKGKKKAKTPPTPASTKPSSSSAAASPSEPIYTNKPLLDNVSPLLFNTHDPLPSSSLPFIGPIAVSTSSTTDIDDDGAPITSDNTAAAVVVHGRGLIVTRDVSAGECLFVIPSILSCHVKEFHGRFVEVLLSRNNDSSNVNDSDDSDGRQFDDDGSIRSYGKELEKIAENVLVESVQSLQTGADYSFQQQRTLQSFMSQMSSEHVPHVNQLDVLLAQSSSSVEENQSIESSTTNTTSLDKETILNIIRRNAFGPDYHSYDTITKYWMDKSNTPDNSTNATTTTASATVNEGYNRLLGVYPLAAMINHSCCPNAVRIFGTIPTMNSIANQEAADILTTTTTVRGQEVMIVHANTFMKRGTEIIWSYLPPTTPHHARREMLQSKYGFTCQCVRCTCEEKATKENYELFHQLTAAATSSTLSLLSNKSDAVEALYLPEMIQSLENCFTSQHSTIISNEASRYIRVGYASLYMQYFNMALSSIHHNNDDNYETTSSSSRTLVTANNLLQLATQLHFSFVSCNNASTEHISILHLCYELASLLHTRSLSYSNNSNNNNNSSKNTMVQIKFWTEQLKQAHMIRYGALGENLECVRKVMKHTRVVLRNRNGWYMVEDRFI